MEKVILPPAVEAEFHGFHATLEVCDSEGKSVGLFFPASSYKKLLATIEIPYSKEELERRRQVKGGTGLKDLWQRLGK
ncbi:MAG: hypothetical protein HYR84_12060 [Planctomycetes bacterium]|nr:hypothetical protein [Planctomycetota bacterium]